MRFRIPSTKKGLTAVGMGILLLIGLIMGGEEESTRDRGKRVADRPTKQKPSKPKTTEPKPDNETLPKEKRPSRRQPTGTPVFVSRVVDGDTIEVTMPNGRTEDVRYIGVDTPETVAPGEPVGCFGPKASAFNEALVEGRRARLRFDQERRDYYGRLLAYVYVGERFVNAELLKRGLARAIYYSPNGAFRYRFEEIARRAGRSGRGLWGACR
ncbi:MAG: thermonuclease family protein [bacterium]